MKEKKQNQKTNKSTEKKTAVAEMLLDEELLKAVSGGDECLYPSFTGKAYHPQHSPL